MPVPPLHAEPFVCSSEPDRSTQTVVTWAAKRSDRHHDDVDSDYIEEQ